MIGDRRHLDGDLRWSRHRLGLGMLVRGEQEATVGPAKKNQEVTGAPEFWCHLEIEMDEC